MSAQALGQPRPRRARPGGIYSPPYDVRCPVNIMAPTSVHEFVTGAKLVHEAAHAVVGLDFGERLAEMWINRPNQSSAVRFAQDVGDGDVFAVISLASEPAVTTWLRNLGQDTPLNLATLDESYLHDRAGAVRVAYSPLSVLHRRAGRRVEGAWDRIIALAQRLADAGGSLHAPIEA
jgi:hypothetical protein